MSTLRVNAQQRDVASLLKPGDQLGRLPRRYAGIVEPRRDKEWWQPDAVVDRLICIHREPIMETLRILDAAELLDVRHAGGGGLKPKRFETPTTLIAAAKSSGRSVMRRAAHPE